MSPRIPPIPVIPRRWDREQPLHRAAETGDIPAAYAAVNAGADVESLELGSRKSALRIAAESGHRALALFLIFRCNARSVPTNHGDARSAPFMPERTCVATDTI